MRPYIQLQELKREKVSTIIQAIGTATKIGPRELENQISKVERFKVKVTKGGRQVRSDCFQFMDFNRKNASNASMTVAAWKKLFGNYYPEFEIDVLTTNGDVAAGNPSSRGRLNPIVQNRKKDLLLAFAISVPSCRPTVLGITGAAMFCGIRCNPSLGMPLSISWF